MTMTPHFLTQQLALWSNAFQAEWRGVIFNMMTTTTTKMTTTTAMTTMAMTTWFDGLGAVQQVHTNLGQCQLTQP